MQPTLPRSSGRLSLCVSCLNIHTAKEGRLAIDDQNLAVIALVDVLARFISGQWVNRIELEHLDACVFQTREKPGGRIERATDGFASKQYKILLGK